MERRSVEVYSFYNDILSAELSIQHPISKQSKAYIRGGEFGDSAFFYAFENVIATRIVESQMLKTYCVMADMQMFVSQPSYDKFGWEVARYCEEQQNYIPIEGEIYPTEKQAKERAAELNQQFKEEEQLKEKGGQV